MAEFINRQEAIEQIKAEWAKLPLSETTGFGILMRVLTSIPAADVWEVVHCADCAHAEESLVNGCVYCNEMERARIKEGFCAWGERKES